MHITYLFLLMSLISCESGNAGQISQPVVAAQVSAPTPSKFFDLHDKYREKTIMHRRFKHRDIVPLITKLQGKAPFEVRKIGQSTEKRDIYLIKAGTGKIKVLLWSQMHGDEPTATMALLDIFNYLGDANNSDPTKNDILKQLTLYFIPMLNPDGAESYKRRTALDIDMNRDAQRRETPEAKILWDIRNELDPEVGFNLHDQSIFYSAGNTNKPATISFLAPAYDFPKSVNETRENAMKLIVNLNQVLQHYIPGQVAKYSDTHEPRGFGDNIQKAGTSTVLIEAGGHYDDPEKQYIRKLKFTILLHAFQAIYEKTYEKENKEAYYDIPENERYMYSLVIRNVQTTKNGQPVLLDIGINHNEISLAGSSKFYYRSAIEELGDMSTKSFGYQELDASGMRMKPGETYPQTISMEALRQMDILALLRKGYTTVRVTSASGSSTTLPINVVSGNRRPEHAFTLSRVPNFTLEKNGQVRYAIINGFVYDVEENKNGVKNALVN